MALPWLSPPAPFPSLACAGAERDFELFITANQNIHYQQNLAGRGIAILELSTNKLRRLSTAAASIQSAIATMKPGEFRHLEMP